jgi:hypothetical protein
MLPLVVFPFLHMLNLDVHGETLGYEVQLVAKSFHQHAAVALHLFKPFIYLIESAVNLIESAVNPFKALVDLLEAAINSFEPAINSFESPVDLLEPLIQPMNEPIKSFVKILNKFLIHTASAVKLNSKPCSLSCQ